MPDVVNLREARKRKVRVDRERVAQENRIRHGRTKAERDSDRSSAEQAIQRVDQHRLTPRSD